MDLITQALGDAAQFIVGRDPELLRIAALSLGVSGIAALLAALLGVPLGAALHLARWLGRRPLVLVVNTGMGSVMIPCFP
jgi:tungstate transport system permease protein